MSKRKLKDIAPFRVTISDIEKMTGANRNTIKKHLSQLVEDQHIVKNGAGRGVWYSVV